MFAAQVATLELTRDDGRELAGNRSESRPQRFQATAISGRALSGSSISPSTSRLVPTHLGAEPLAWRARDQAYRAHPSWCR